MCTTINSSRIQSALSSTSTSHEKSINVSHVTACKQDKGAENGDGDDVDVFFSQRVHKACPRADVMGHTMDCYEVQTKFFDWVIGLQPLPRFNKRVKHFEVLMRQWATNCCHYETTRSMLPRRVLMSCSRNDDQS